MTTVKLSTKPQNTHLLAHHEHISAPQVLVGRLAVQGILEERRHSSRHSVAVEVVRLRLRVGVVCTGTRRENDPLFARTIAGIVVLGQLCWLFAAYL